MSIHTSRARLKARAMGAYAGRVETADLWDLPKRELIEIALRLGEICADTGGGFDGAIARVREEREVLRQQGII